MKMISYRKGNLKHSLQFMNKNKVYFIYLILVYYTHEKQTKTRSKLKFPSHHQAGRKLSSWQRTD